MRAAGGAVLSAPAAEGAERSGWEAGPMPCAPTAGPVASAVPAHSVQGRLQHMRLMHAKLECLAASP